MNAAQSTFTLVRGVSLFYSDETIETIRSAADVVDVVGEYVRLKRSGSNYFGLCPFHSEKTASFSVNPDLGIFKCFGCGAGGDVFQFIMRVEGVTFPESVRLLADKVGVELPEEGDEERRRIGELEAVYNALRFAARFYYHQLTQTEGGKRALAYVRERGYTPTTIKRFGLGYAPDQWDALLKAAEAHHISAEVLEQAGLVIPRKDAGGHYDRFRGRLLFPILSHVGKVLGFGGRVLTAGSDQPKYINSPETKVYNKSRVLYGLSQAKHAIRKKEEALLVEGYTDVIAMHQAGLEHVVATSGTSLTPEQVQLLGRYARRLVLVFDADAAGAGAARRGIDIVLRQGMSVYVVELPPGEDPDTFVARGEGKIQEFVDQQRMDFPAFLHAQAKKSGQLDTPEGQAEVMHEIVTAIACMPDPLMQETHLRRVGEIFSVPDARLHDVLEVELRKERASTRRRRPPDGPGEAAPPVRSDRMPRTSRAPRKEPSLLPEELTLIRLMLEHGSSMVEFVLGNTSLEEFTPGPARKLSTLLLEQYEHGSVNRQPFLDGSYGEDVQRLATEVSVVRHEPSENWERKQRISVPRLDEDPYEAAVSAMTLLKLDRVHDAIEQQREEIFRAAKAGEDLQPLQTQMMALHALRRRIERREFLEEEDEQDI